MALEWIQGVVAIVFLEVEINGLRQWGSEKTLVGAVWLPVTAEPRQQCTGQGVTFCVTEFAPSSFAALKCEPHGANFVFFVEDFPEL